jgi:hypothetical protein
LKIPGLKIEDLLRIEDWGIEDWIDDSIFNPQITKSSIDLQSPNPSIFNAPSPLSQQN